MSENPDFPSNPSDRPSRANPTGGRMSEGTTFTTEERLASLIGAVEAMGYRVADGDFVLGNGSHSPYALVPSDLRRILQSAQRCCLGDHDNHCCTVHGTHSMPHKGCILR